MPFLLNQQQRANHVGLVTCIAFGASLLSHCHPVAAQMIYWTDGTDNTIQRATVDGENVVKLICGGLDRPDGIAIDPAAKKMYWAEWGGRIQRADLDGANIELLVDAGGTPRDVALDLPRQKLYWIEFAAQRIRRADFDGGNVETVNDADTIAGTGIAIDSAGGKIYWINSAISRMNLDGSAPELVFADNGFPREIDLDTENGWLYWVNSQFQFIGRATFPEGVPDNDVQIVPGVPGDVAVDPASEQLYWTDRSFGSIMRSDIGGGNKEAIVSEGTTEPLGIAIGPPPDWAIEWESHIADPDGSWAKKVAINGTTLWFATPQGGVTEWDTVTLTGRRYTVETHQLPSDQTLDITVDVQGDVWVATAGGVGRRLSAIDPSSPWIIYDSGNSPIQGVTSIEADLGGGVWIGTFENGLYFFDGVTWINFNPQNSGLGNPFVTSVFVDSANNKWMGTWGGVFRHDDENWEHFNSANTGGAHGLCLQFDPDPPAPEGLGLITDITVVFGEDSLTGAIWIRSLDDSPCLNEALSRFDGMGWTTYSPFNSAIHFSPQDVAIDATGLTWIATEGGIQTVQASVFQNFGPPEAPAHAYSLAPVGADMWFGTGIGTSRLRDGVFANFTPGGLADNSVRTIAFRTVDGPIETWIGHEQGTQRISGDTWQHFRPTNSPQAGLVTKSIGIDLDGSVWLATGRALPQNPSDLGGVQHIVDGEWTTFTIDNSGLVSNQVVALAIDPVTGDKWFVYAGIGVGATKFDGSLWTHYPATCGATCVDGCTPDHFMTDVEVGPDGVVWFANTGCGLVRFDGQSWKVFGEDVGLPFFEGRSVTVAPDGAVWVGTGGGLARFDGQVATPFLVGQSINDVAVDPRGLVWAATQDSGVSVFDGTTWTVFDTSNGLPSNQVNTISVHPVGDVWLGTEGGLAVAAFPSEGPPCPPDLNGDGIVDAADLANLLGSWGPCKACPADLDGDGIVNAADLAILLGSWGPCEACHAGTNRREKGPSFLNPALRSVMTAV